MLRPKNERSTQHDLRTRQLNPLLQTYTLYISQTTGEWLSYTLWINQNISSQAFIMIDMYMNNLK